MILSDPELTPTSIERDPLGLTPLPVDNRDRFLRFVLNQKSESLLPLAQIVEVMQLALEDIFPVPDMPGCVLGVCSWQGETLWLIDLNHFVGFPPLYQQSDLTNTPIVIVVRSEERSSARGGAPTLGLVVERVEDVDLFDQESIRMEPGLCSPSFEPFVLGYCPNQGGNVLDVSAIFKSPLWTSHKGEGS